MDRTILKMIAVKKPSTSNPLTTKEVNKIKKALITKLKRPRLKILIGRVNITKNGLIETLTTAKKAATKKEVQIPLT